MIAGFRRFEWRPDMAGLAVAVPFWSTVYNTQQTNPACFFPGFGFGETRLSGGNPGTDMNPDCSGLDKPRVFMDESKARAGAPGGLDGSAAAEERDNYHRHRDAYMNDRNHASGAPRPGRESRVRGRAPRLRHCACPVSVSGAPRLA